MLLSEYKTLKEKERFFKKSRKICNIEELDEWVSEMRVLEEKSETHTCFRGLCEAKYKNYTSLQRYWIEHDVGETGAKIKDIVQGMLDMGTSRHALLRKYFNALGVVPNDWLILSFLQHYQAPSPLLDFTRSLDVALYFACNEVRFPNKDEEIDHFFSIYYYKSVDASKKIRNLMQVARSINKETGDENDKLIKRLSFNHIVCDDDVLMVPTYEGKTEVRTKRNYKKKEADRKICEFPIANMNSIRQHGEFVCNTYEENPLEEVFCTKEAGEIKTKYLHCANIHKALVGYITKKYLGDSLEICSSKYFVKEKDIANEAAEVLTKLQ